MPVLRDPCVRDNYIQTPRDFADCFNRGLDVGVGGRLELQDVDVWTVRCESLEGGGFSGIACPGEDGCPWSLGEDFDNFEADATVRAGDEIGGCRHAEIYYCDDLVMGFG